MPRQCREPRDLPPLARQDLHITRRRPWRAHRSAVYQGYVIPPYYDSLVGKLIVHGKTEANA